MKRNPMTKEEEITWIEETVSKMLENSMNKIVFSVIDNMFPKNIFMEN